MVGLATRPGTAGEPVCSIRNVRLPSVPAARCDRVAVSPSASRLTHSSSDDRKVALPGTSGPDAGWHASRRRVELAERLKRKVPEREGPPAVKRTAQKTTHRKRA
jgi:hypothetical protein